MLLLVLFGRVLHPPTQAEDSSASPERPEKHLLAGGAPSSALSEGKISPKRHAPSRHRKSFSGARTSSAPARLRTT